MVRTFYTRGLTLRCVINTFSFNYCSHYLSIKFQAYLTKWFFSGIYRSVLLNSTLTPERQFRASSRSGAMSVTKRVDYRPFINFLNELARDISFVEEASEIVIPLYEVSENADDGYPLYESGQLNPEDVAKAIALAVGEEPDRIVFVSAFNPGSEAMRAVEEALSESPRHTLWETLWLRHGDEIEQTLSQFDEGHETTCSESMCLYIGNMFYELDKAFKKGMQHNLHESLSSTLTENIETCIQVFWGFAVASKANRLEELRPLMKILSAAVPIAKTSDDFGTWLVLVA